MTFLFRASDWLIVLTAVLALGTVCTEAAEPFPGQRSNYHGFDRFDFTVDECKALVVAPREPAAGKPWIWRAMFFDHRPETDLALLARGFHLAYIEVGNTFGCPDALRHWDAFYETLTGTYGLAPDPALEGLSRGGLYVCNWAARHPESVGCIYADNAVFDFKSWPGGKGRGPGSKNDWAKLLQDYHFTSEAESLAFDKNPVDNLAPLAKARVPLYLLCGDADEVVPINENGGLVHERYKKLGGPVVLHIKPGTKHHPHGLDDPTPIVDFILKATGQDETGFVPLLPRGDLAAWVEEQHDFFRQKHPNISTWSVAEGVLHCDGSYGNCGFLRYHTELEDFIFRCDYRLAKGGNSGVGIRARVPYTTLKPNTLPSNVGFEVQLFDDAPDTRPEQGNGAFYNLLAPLRKIALPAEVWHALEIRCVGPRIEVRIDRRKVQDVDQNERPELAGRPLRGFLSLQNHGHAIEFRNLRLRQL